MGSVGIGTWTPFDRFSDWDATPRLTTRPSRTRVHDMSQWRADCHLLRMGNPVRRVGRLDNPGSSATIRYDMRTYHRNGPMAMGCRSQGKAVIRLPRTRRAPAGGRRAPRTRSGFRSALLREIGFDRRRTRDRDSRETQDPRWIRVAKRTPTLFDSPDPAGRAGSAISAPDPDPAGAGKGRRAIVAASGATTRMSAPPINRDVPKSAASPSLRADP
jgi:hypothetical protein